MADWSRVASTTIAKYVREREINIMRNRKLLAMAKEKGRITFNWSGTLMDWKIKYRRANISGYADSDTLTFSRKDRHKTAQLEYRGYVVTDSITKKEKLQNSGVEAIVKVWSDIAVSLADDIDDEFGDELYIDGNATGNGKRIHGIESIFASTTSQSGNYVGVNGATYAGLVTTLANYGGAWSGTWPTGTGDAHYDFFTPLVVDYTNSAWAASTKTWQYTCEEALRYGIIKAKKNKSKKGSTDLILLNDELYRQFQNAQDAKGRILITRGQKGGLTELGYGDVMNFEGVEITQEYGVPANVGYGWNFDEFELRSMQDQMFVPGGPVLDESSQSYRFWIDFYGNCSFNPRHGFIKFVNLS